MRDWTVAGGLLETPDGVLLVRNIRRGGWEDWSTPGGVIDADDADLLAGLTREVEEETGLRVEEWSGPLYEVHAYAPDMQWRMRCEVHLAVAFTGVVQTRLFLASWSGLVTSAYGLLVLAKTAGLVALVAFGAYHRQRLMPQVVATLTAATGARVLRASVVREVIVIAIVILLGGLLAYVPPPSEGGMDMSSHESTS